MSFCGTIGSIVQIGNSLTLLHIYFCLIHKTLLNLYCFTSVFSFQHRLTSLCHNLLILNFQLDISLALHVQWTTQSFPLISLTGSDYFVEKLNSDCEPVHSSLIKQLNVFISSLKQEVPVWHGIHHSPSSHSSSFLFSMFQYRWHIVGFSNDLPCNHPQLPSLPSNHAAVTTVVTTAKVMPVFPFQKFSKFIKTF